MGPEPAEQSQRQQPKSAARLESAVVVVVDVPALDEVYRDSYPVMVEQGIPLHVTLLYPFVPPSELDAALPVLRSVLAGHERFDFSLTRLRTFPRVVWAAPEPAAPFVALTEAIYAAFPEYPPHAGEFADVIPHMTLAYPPEAELGSTLARLRHRVDPLLPLAVSAAEATVVAEQEDGQWIVAARLPLGTAPTSESGT